MKKKTESPVVSNKLAKVDCDTADIVITLLMSEPVTSSVETARGKQ